MAMKKIIKVIDPAVAKKMSAAGFNYMLEKNGQIETYVFSVTPQQVADLQKAFSKGDFVVENRLRF